MFILGVHTEKLEESEHEREERMGKVKAQLTKHLNRQFNDVDDTLYAVTDDKDNNNDNEDGSNIYVSTLLFIYGAQTQSPGS